MHTGRGKTRYLSGSTERVQEEELKRQQNRNRKNEEGLQSDGEGKWRGLANGSEPALQAAMPSLSPPRTAPGDRRGGGSWGSCECTHTRAHPAPCCGTHTQGPRRCSSEMRSRRFLGQGTRAPDQCGKHSQGCSLWRSQRSVPDS